MNKLVLTEDGSFTFFNEQIGEHYHSIHGALQESKHVFIEAGLKYVNSSNDNTEISVLEIGFGTGLNCLLSFQEAEKNQFNLNYVGLEAYPLSVKDLELTGYNQFVDVEIWNILIRNYHQCLQNKKRLSPFIQLEIIEQKLETFTTALKFDIVYFDAFSVRHQPELWSDERISQVCSFIKEDGVFVTYAITGNLKRALKSNNFIIEKLPGPPGKREMLRAIKKSN